MLSSSAQQPMRLICKAYPSLNLAVRGDEVVLERADPSDESHSHQGWILDLDHDSVGRVTDEQGRRAFALVNVATGKALVHHRGGRLQLAPYTGHDGVKICMLWSLSARSDDGFSEIRDLSNMDSTINAGEGKEGKRVGLFRYYKSKETYDYTVWKMVPITTSD